MLHSSSWNCSFLHTHNNKVVVNFWIFKSKLIVVSCEAKKEAEANTLKIDYNTNDP